MTVWVVNLIVLIIWMRSQITVVLAYEVVSRIDPSIEMFAFHTNEHVTSVSKRMRTVIPAITK